MSNWVEKIKSNQQYLALIDKAAPFVLLCLIIYLCWKLASIFWLLVAPPQVHQAEAVTLGSRQAQVPSIDQFALFYQAGQNPAAQDEQLNLSLQGVVVGSPQQFSSAVIKVMEQADRYRVGETVEGTNYQLAEVQWNKVVLRQNNGATRTLEFQGVQNGLYQPVVAQTNTRQRLGIASTPPQTNSEQQLLGQATQRLQDNREQYLQEMGVQSSSEGYEVSARSPTALRNKLGLQPGDRILSLNGQTMASGQTEAQLLEQVKKQGQVRLEIKRGDQTMTIQQDLK